MPFSNLRELEVGFAVPNGTRPQKPYDALAAGLSDSLWGFLQLCWNGDRGRRPRAAEVVAEVGSAAASWDVHINRNRINVSLPVGRPRQDRESTSLI